MKRLFAYWSVGTLAAITTFACAGDLPTAPPNLKDVEAQGLHRLSSEELKPLLSGVVESKGTEGQHKLIYKPDGTVARTGAGVRDLTGKWRIDDKNNAYCLAFSFKKGYQENCFAVFRTSDGIHYFDYDIANGFYAHIWSQSSE